MARKPRKQTKPSKSSKPKDSYWGILGAQKTYGIDRVPQMTESYKNKSSFASPKKADKLGEMKVDATATKSKSRKMPQKGDSYKILG
jgi:hypothetical protein